MTLLMTKVVNYYETVLWFHSYLAELPASNDKKYLYFWTIWISQTEFFDQLDIYHTLFD